MTASNTETTQEKQCYQLIFYDKGAPPLKELKEALETGNVEKKRETMKRVILLHLNGEPQPQLLMTIIRFILPDPDHTLKKLLLYYFEIVDKTQPNGKLLPEFILVPNYLMQNLTHPNEYIRGCTLRLMCKIKEPELLQPLVSQIVANLEHRHSYVRRNAVLAVYSIYSNFEQLIPDAPELVEKFLESESDISGKRNAFIMLFNCDQARAIKYLRGIMDTVSNIGDAFQLVLLDCLKKLCRTNPTEKVKYLRVISSLLTSKSPAVLYQCAGTLVSLSSSPTAVKAAAGCYTQLLSHSDNNVKLIVLDRLVELKTKYPRIMQDVVMDLLRALSSPDMDIRKKVLQIVMDLITQRNVDEIIAYLKKEVLKTQGETDKTENEYRQLLVQSIHQCAVKFPEVAQNVIHLLMDFLSDTTGAALDVIVFAREIIELYPNLRESILQKLCTVFYTIRSSRVYRVALWILGDYSDSSDEVATALRTIKASLGELPFVPQQTQAAPTDDKAKQKTVEKDFDTESVTSSASAGNESAASKASTNPRVRSDGTYATQSALLMSDTKEGKAEAAAQKVVSLRTLLMSGEFFMASVLATSLTKLALKAYRSDQPVTVKNDIMSDVMLILTSIIRLGQSTIPPHLIDDDSRERILTCIRLLSRPDSSTSETLLVQSKQAFSNILKDKKRKDEEEKNKKQADESNKTVAYQVDSLLTFSQLRADRSGLGNFDEGEDLLLAVGNVEKTHGGFSKLNRITQLTGFSDPVYAEATVTVHQFDILLDVLVVNQSNDTLQNLTLELATIGDLKLCERPQSYTIGRFGSQHIKANIKVSSTETGIIFGNIVYDTAGAASDRSCVIMNEIHIDIMDYIHPATCTDIQFRCMWAEFEWENKITINTNITDLHQFLNHIIKVTNMQCLTPEGALGGDCEFLSANLYAKSSFGEDALANVSMERLESGKIEGFVRIRSKSQGIALSLGDKITREQNLVETSQS